MHHVRGAVRPGQTGRMAAESVGAQCRTIREDIAEKMSAGMPAEGIPAKHHAYG